MSDARRGRTLQAVTLSDSHDIGAKRTSMSGDRCRRQTYSLEDSDQIATPASGSLSVSTTQPRYIALPDDLYALRRRFPSVLHAVYLECTRCRRWVAVDVLPSVPEEVRTATPMLLGAGVANLAVSELRGADGASASSGAGGVATASRPRRRGRSCADGASFTTEWHSPRLRAHAELQQAIAAHDESDAGTVGAGSKSVSAASPATETDLRRESALLASLAASSLNAGESDTCESVRPALFIPNPVNFVCPWQSCERADLLLDLRQEWLARLHEALSAKSKAAVLATPHAEDLGEGGDGAQPQLSQAALNEVLARELDVRRSDRLASRPRRDGHATMLDAAHSRTGSVVVPDLPSHAGSGGGGAGQEQMLRSVADSLSTDAETFLSAFCWVVCERCGKLRRVAQPFPGGAPFICALAASVGTCALSERDALRRYTERYLSSQLAQVAVAPRRPAASHETSTLSAHANASCRLASEHHERRTGNDQPIDVAAVALREAQQRSRRSRDVLEDTLGGDALVQAVRTVCRPADTAHLHTRCRTQPSAGHQDGLCVLLPLVKELAACVRKKSMGSLLAQVALAPEAIRRKRDEVLRGLIADTPAAAPVADVTVRSVGQGGGRLRRTASGHSCERSRKRVRRSASPPPSVLPAVVHDVDTQVLSATSSQDVHDGDVVVLRQAAPRRGRGRLCRQATAEVPLPASTTARRGGGRGRKPVARREDDTQELNSEDEDVIHWVLCDRCGKWRVVPRPVSKTLTYWECHMRDDHTTCDDTDDETRMQKGQTVR